MSDSQKFIGDKLRSAREELSKSISEMSEKTNIRKSYLAALEEEDFETLPESIYTRNFIKLYARALNIEHKDLIDYYQSHFQKDEIETVNNIPEYKDFAVKHKSSGNGSKLWIPLILLLLLLAAAAGLWFFNRDFVYKNLPWLNPQQSTSSIGETSAPTIGEASTTAIGETATPATGETTAPSDIETATIETTATDADNADVANTDSSNNQPETSEPDIVDTADSSPNSAETSENTITANEVPDTIKLSIITDPPGATVNIDNFIMAQKTPVIDAPVSSGKQRSVLLSLDGFISYSEELDLTKDTVLEVGLEPIQVIETTDENGETVTQPESRDDNTITIKTTEDTWLEVWQGDQRNQGNKLVYKMLPAGREFNFELPVYVHTGNAGGVHIYVGDKDLGKMGSKGEVLGKAFSAD